MDNQSIQIILIVIITGLITYRGLSDRLFQEKYLFNIDKILIEKEYNRIFSSGFLHANWIHYGFNMLVLISFANSIEALLGIKGILIVYFSSLLGGSLLTLYIHRNHGDYTAVGASGAVSGIVSSSIILFPTSKIGLILMPFELLSWVFGLIFILVSILGIKSQSDNIGHEAHLGGLLIGIILTSLMVPNMVFENWIIVLCLLFPIFLFLFLILKRPDILITGKWNLKVANSLDAGRKKISLDSILEKINRSGIESLSKKERKALEEYRNKMN